MGVFIKPAAGSDAAIIADLSRKTFYETFAQYNTKANMDKYMNEQFTREMLIKEVETGNGYFFIAFDEERPVGYVRMQDGDKYAAFGDRSSVEIVRIYADNSVIGKGVGSAMMKFCIEEAKQMNREILWLGVWEKNDRAVAFYEKWGFKKFGAHDFWLGYDQQTDWLMMREL
ncbi:MAG: GNAT family N-acetyltransferase [Sphingobacteriales bacterium]|nr:GNAT family N-acetyltransferase [Sphingobacteriales bacterium]